MFNKTTIHRTETTVTPVTRVIEKTITPDKVSDMYKEVRAEVEKSILRTFIVETNKMNGVIVETMVDYSTLKRKVHVHFELNGKEHFFTEIVEGELKQIELYEIFAEFFNREVAKVVMQDAIKILRKP